MAGGGGGGYTVNISGLSAKGNFSEGEAQMDSTWVNSKVLSMFCAHL